MYLHFEQVATTAVVKGPEDLTIPSSATHVELQADTQPCRYTMDGLTPPAQTSGMILSTSSDPKTFLVTDLRRIKFTRGAGSDGKLNIHYFNGR